MSPLIGFVVAGLLRLVKALLRRPEWYRAATGKAPPPWWIRGLLVLTCTGDLSRNRRVGLGLASGRPLAEILDELGHVAEGVAAARHVRVLCRALGVDMPICEAVYRVLYEDVTPRRAVESLLAREHGPEFH